MMWSPRYLHHFVVSYIFCRVYALLAVSGLLSYIEDSLSMYLAPKTMRMLYHSGVHCMLIGKLNIHHDR